MILISMTGSAGFRLFNQFGFFSRGQTARALKNLAEHDGETAYKESSARGSYGPRKSRLHLFFSRLVYLFNNLFR